LLPPRSTPFPYTTLFRSSTRSGAAHQLPAIRLDRLHDGGAGGRLACAATVFERQLDLEAAEEFVEHLAAQRAGGEQAVGRRIVLEQYRRERLRGRPGQHARAIGGVVLAVLRAAVDHLAAPGHRRRLVAIADEADVARGVSQAVRA